MKYLTGGGGFVIGFRSGNYSAQLRLSYFEGLLYRIRKSGVWENWETSVLTSDLGYVDCAVDTVKDGWAVIPNSPATKNGYLPVVYGHSQTSEVLENVFYDVTTWRIYSTVSQNVNIRFYKYPV